MVSQKTALNALPECLPPFAKGILGRSNTFWLRAADKTVLASTCCFPRVSRSERTLHCPRFFLETCIALHTAQAFRDPGTGWRFFRVLYGWLILQDFLLNSQPASALPQLNKSLKRWRRCQAVVSAKAWGLFLPPIQRSSESNQIANHSLRIQFSQGVSSLDKIVTVLRRWPFQGVSRSGRISVRGGPATTMGEEEGGSKHERKHHRSHSLSSRFPYFFLSGRWFSIHSLALVNWQNSEIVHFRDCAHIFAVVGGQQGLGGPSSTNPEAYQSLHYFKSTFM